MSAPVDFYFDFASPYGYIAAQSIDALAARHGRTVNWHAIVLDANFQSLERIRIPSSVMRSEYILRDVERYLNFTHIIIRGIRRGLSDADDGKVGDVLGQRRVGHIVEIDDESRRCSRILVADIVFFTTRENSC